MQELTEEQKWKLKYFDYAENIVKKWISEYLKKNPMDLFNDYDTSFDIISCKYNNKTYTIYLKITDTLDKNEFKLDGENTEDIRKGISIMYDSVLNVFNPILQTMLIEPPRSLAPQFIEENLTFKLKYLNKHQIKKQYIEIMMNEFMGRLPKVNDEKKKQEMLKHMNNLNEELKTITQEMIENEEKICIQKNNNLKNGPYIKICIDNNFKMTDQLIVKRLPKIGIKYYDPDEDETNDVIFN